MKEFLEFLKTNAWQLVALVLGILVFCWAFWLLLINDPGVSAAAPATAPIEQTTYNPHKSLNPQSSFDHSTCQYPNRQSNPPDGCDNSDPARPECVKFGVEDCDLPSPDAPTVENVDTVAPAASQKQTANSCSE